MEKILNISPEPGFDYLGARASNAGDQFHELWALQHILDLLKPKTSLMAVGVEGVISSGGKANSRWEGVDCALYFGGTSLETVDRVDFIQVKYSAANPEIVWTLARLTHNSSKKSNNSPIRRLAETYTSAIIGLKPEAEFVIRFVSNQDLTNEVKQLIKDRWVGPLNKSKLSVYSKTSHRALIKASGLNEHDYQSFLEKLNFDECGTDSRFVLKDKLIEIIGGFVGANVSSELRSLQMRVRELMLPEQTNEIVTLHSLLLWFDVTSLSALFPCPSEINLPDQVIKRSVADQVVKKILGGEQLVLLHGEGGCGKTTLINQIAGELPKGSVNVHFDCFGGGSYLYSDDQRHSPESAFLQLTNELSTSLQLPLFISANRKNPVTIRTFMTKLSVAGETLSKIEPNAILLISLDAADNSISAAMKENTGRRSFVAELLDANLSSLPSNVHFIITCRTSRKSFFQLPAETPDIQCPPFSMEETRSHLELKFPQPDEILVDQFHFLSYGNPRVQTYSIANSNGDDSKLLTGLRPKGKTLPEVLQIVFKNALRKIGESGLYNSIMGTLAYLPPPVPLVTFSRIIGCEMGLLRDFVLDLSPGLKLSNEAITIADEDYDAFIKDFGNSKSGEFISKITESFLTTFKKDSYSSVHIAEILKQANRVQEILEIIEQDQKVDAIKDPILNRQVKLKRLRYSLSACRESGSVTKALKTILISAEAYSNEGKLDQIFEKEIDLAVPFAGSSLARIMGNDPEKIKTQGSFLAHDALRAIREGDQRTAREQLYFYNAWLKKRRELSSEERQNWLVSSRDIAARVETIFELAGPQVALNEILKWSPPEIAVSVAFILLPDLISAGKISKANELFSVCQTQKPWDLLIVVPLALAGEKINKVALTESIKKIRQLFVPDLDSLDFPGEDGEWKPSLMDTFITSCELGYSLDIESKIIQTAVNTIFLKLRGKNDSKLFGSAVHRFDGLLRCWLLLERVKGNSITEERFTEFIYSFNKQSQISIDKIKKNTKVKNEFNSADQRERESQKNRIKSLFPIYSARLDILSQRRQNIDLTETQFDKLIITDRLFYAFDLEYNNFKYREKAADSLMCLLMIDFVNPVFLFEKAKLLTTSHDREPGIDSLHLLWRKMRLRSGEAESLVSFVSEASKQIKNQKIPSSGKVDGLIKIARLILPVSKEDSRVLFRDAVSVSEEIDFEIFDQIKFTSKLSATVFNSRQTTHKQLATDFTVFVSEAATRLSDWEEFPWKEAVETLTYLDEYTALSALSRWDDEGSVRLETTLNSFLVTAMEINILTPEEIISLSLARGKIADDLRKSLISVLATKPKQYSKVIEEFTKDTLLLNGQADRFNFGREFLEKFGQNFDPDWEWTKQLSDMVEFYKPINKEAESQQNKQQKKWNPLSDGSFSSEEFLFEANGRSFITSKMIEDVFKEAGKTGSRVEEKDILLKMRASISHPNQKLLFLNALTGVSEDLFGGTHWGSFLCDTLQEWRDTPSVENWCKEILPGVIINQFTAISQWIYYEQSALVPLLNYAKLNRDDWIKTVLDGIAKSSDSLDNRTLYGLAGEIARKLEPDEASEIISWYIKHLCNRLQETVNPIAISEMPQSKPEAIARFLFSLLSDIDTRVRWRAAHSLRRFARLGCTDIIHETILQINRERDDAFRDPAAPFYYLGAKLWLAISLYRISAESPGTLKSDIPVIFELATSSKLPHVVIREYAKRTLLLMRTAGTISISEPEYEQLLLVNSAKKGKIKDSNSRHSKLGSPVWPEQTRFKFDRMDTLHYWYEDLWRIFPDVFPETVLTLADNWILDKWNGFPESTHWKKEPRVNRFTEGSHHLFSHYHGAFPVIERYGTYLEWHAMYCVAGELLKTMPISEEEEYSFGSFTYLLKKTMPLNPPNWASDFRGPTPLEMRFWQKDKKTDHGWVNNIGLSEFLTEIGIGDSTKNEWVVVSARYTIHYPKRETFVEVNTGMVSQTTSTALVRALQTSKNKYDFGIPHEDNRFEITEPPFSFIGWLSGSESAEAFDQHDPFRYEVETTRRRPDQKIRETLNLVLRTDNPGDWLDGTSGEKVFKYEAWSDEPVPDRDYYSDHIRSSGWRLWVKTDILKQLLLKEGWDLLFEIQNDRNLKSENRTSYDPNEKRKEHEKIILLKADGTIKDSKGIVGTW
ncbi:MAG: hypothetical protein LCH54_03830 [Bacteroidetes bacterium]|nr:hypothetical protein [Bacteroidota bacterium]